MAMMWPSQQKQSEQPVQKEEPEDDPMAMMWPSQQKKESDKPGRQQKTSLNILRNKIADFNDDLEDPDALDDELGLMWPSAKQSKKKADPFALDEIGQEELAGPSIEQNWDEKPVSKGQSVNPVAFDE